MRSCTPTPSAPSATGRQLQKSQKSLACPKARPNRSRHRYADPVARGGPLHRSALKRPFLLDRAIAQPLAALPLTDAAYPLRVRPVFFSAKTEKGPPLRPARWGEEAQGSGRSFRRRRKRSLADFATTTMGGASRWTSPLREQTPPWPPSGGPYRSRQTSSSSDRS